MKSFLIGAACCAVAACVALPVQAAAPAKVADIATVDELVAEIDEQLAALDAALQDAAAFAEAKKGPIPQAAGVVACMAQAIVEHPDKAKAKLSAPDLRDAAVAAWKAPTHADAVAAAGRAKEARAGKASGAVPEAEWNKLIRLGRMMEEINARNSKLRSLLRRPKDPASDGRLAASVAVLALAMEADTHEVKNPAEIPQWNAWSSEFRKQMITVSVALKKGDAETAKTAYLAAAKSCNDCHEKFRDDGK